MRGWRQPGRKQQQVQIISGQSTVTQESKAYDAVIVAVGIVAVLLANVAYVSILCSMCSCLSLLSRCPLATVVSF